MQNSYLERSTQAQIGANEEIGARFTTYDENQLLEFIADQLAMGNSVGWFRERWSLVQEHLEPVNYC